jgi:hypothetical protein
VTDFDDAFNDHLKTHAKQRQSIIEGTAGFDRFILKNGADFNLEKLGYAKMKEAA